MATHAEAARMILRRSQLALRGLPVTYITKKGKRLPLKAIPAKLDAVMIDAQEALSTQIRTLDWLINPDHLVLREKLFEPDYGDQLICTLKGFERTYELVQGDAGHRWFYTDGMQTFVQLTMTQMEVKRV